MRRLERALLRWIGSDRALPIQLDITNACNLRCAHCYHPHHRNDGAIGANVWKEILDQYRNLIRRMGFAPFVIVCGGEPLASSNLEPILSHAIRIGLSDRLMVLTNGTLAERGNLLPFRSFARAIFQVSLDGHDAASHDRVRGPGAFAAAEKGARRLISEGFEVQLQCALSKRTAEHVDGFFSTAVAWGTHRMEFTRLVALGHAEGLVARDVDRPLLPHELRDAYLRILTASARSGVKTSTAMPLMHLLHPALGGSGRFADGIVVDYQGRLLASSRSRLGLGDVVREGLESLFLRHPLLTAVRAGKIRACGTCPHLRRCGGDRNAAFAATGDFLGADPGCWVRHETSMKEGEVA